MPSNPDSYTSVDGRRGTWKIVFRVLIVLLGLSTLNGLRVAIFRKPDVQIAFPGIANPVLYFSMLAAAVLGLVSLVGLWRWERWAVVLYGLLGIATIVLDALVDAPVLHQVTVAVSTCVILGLAFANRHRFRSRIDS